MEGYDGEIISRKIKQLQIGIVERYKNQFLQFGLNTGIGTHFTNKIHGLAKKINRSLLEKTRCLLSNAKLDKCFGLKRLYMLAIS